MTLVSSWEAVRHLPPIYAFLSGKLTARGFARPVIYYSTFLLLLPFQPAFHPHTPSQPLSIIYISRQLNPILGDATPSNQSFSLMQKLSEKGAMELIFKATKPHRLLACKDGRKGVANHANLFSVFISSMCFVILLSWKCTGWCHANLKLWKGSALPNILPNI